MDKAVDRQLDRIYEAVRARITGHRNTERALSDLEGHPTDTRKQGRLEYALESVLEQDPRFAAELAALLDRVDQPSFREIVIRDAGAVALDGDVNLRGNNVAGRDLIGRGDH